MNPSDEDVNMIFLFLLLRQPAFGSAGKISKFHLTMEKCKMTWSAMRFKAVAGSFRLHFETKPALFSFLNPSRHHTTTTGLFVPKNKSEPTQRIYFADQSGQKYDTSLSPEITANHLLLSTSQL